MARTRRPPGPVTPRPLAPARQIRPAAPVAAGKPAARPAGRSQDSPTGAGRSAGQAGTQDPDATPIPAQDHKSRAGTGEAEPEAPPTAPLPSMYLLLSSAVVACGAHISHFGCAIPS